MMNRLTVQLVGGDAKGRADLAASIEREAGGLGFEVVSACVGRFDTIDLMQLRRLDMPPRPAIPLDLDPGKPGGVVDALRAREAAFQD